MPWEIRIVSAASGEPLGSAQAVGDWLSERLPGVDLRLPPAPPEEFYAFLSEETREFMKNNRNLEALYEEQDFIIQFYCPDKALIECLHAEVRGNGNPVPVLARMCVPKGWVVLNSADQSYVDLGGAGAHQWDLFRGWRDKAIGQIKNEEQ